MDATLALNLTIPTTETLTEELKALFAQAGVDVTTLESLLDPRVRVVLGAWI